eukprot:snap_masked-scaffold_23-processed-gene-4.31-mRNA-1 protein AED:1.00 eAED:1.00 QI:0/0/0/0/1/1/2/0/59
MCFVSELFIFNSEKVQLNVFQYEGNSDYYEIHPLLLSLEIPMLEVLSHCRRTYELNTKT